MTDSEREELDELRREHHLSSLGDRPHSIAAHKLQRLIDLETLERIELRMHERLRAKLIDGTRTSSA